MPTTPHASRSDLLQIAIAYENKKGIADKIAPYTPVDEENFDWVEHSPREGFQTGDGKVGRYAPAEQLTFSSHKKSDSTEDYGYSSPVPKKDKMKTMTMKGMIDPDGVAVEGILRRVTLDREKRVADIVFNTNTYLTDLRRTLNGSDRWNDPNSSPITQIKEACLAPNLLGKPNYGVLGAEGWAALSTNPEIVEAVLGTGAKKGIATREAVARLFELDGILVGESKRDDANPGSPMDLRRLWGKHFALIRINPLARTMRTQQPTFMLTARFGQRVVDSEFVKQMGLHGGTVHWAGESVKEVVISQYCGYFYQNVID